ncbi:hypothetical protein [Alsobacter sp. R-9]
MPDQKLHAAISLFPERSTLIVRLAERSCVFRALCGDLNDVREFLMTRVQDGDKAEYGQLLQELTAELAEWIDAPQEHGGES